MTKKVEEMSTEERIDWMRDMVIFLESAIESEQTKPAEFKVETEKRLGLVFRHLESILGLPSGWSAEGSA